MSQDSVSLIEAYNSSISVTVDRHAPLQEIKSKDTSRKLWYNNTIHEARQKRRQLEQKFRKAPLEINKQMFLSQRDIVVKLIDDAKTTYYRDKLTSANTKEVFSVIHELLSPRTTQQLPPAGTTLELANSFIDFFHSKVSKIRTELDQLKVGPPPPLANKVFEFKLESFLPITEPDLHKLIMSCPSKSCSQDPIPTWLLKDLPVLQVLVPLMTTLINTSLTEGIVPLSLKSAQITPVLKKEGLDTKEFKNFRPVSNLPFLSKLLERVVARQLTDHMTKHGLHDSLQSAYRPKHSTETALLKIKCDIDQALERGEGTILLLLDLSAAFDTLDHNIILERLCKCVGVSDLALRWFASYLSDRQQCICIGDTKSHPVDLSIGVPQGSVLGPLLFLIYILPLGEVISQHRVSRHGYADDSQTYTHFKLQDPTALLTAIQRLEKCASDIKMWMAHNKLKLNDSKSEVLIVAPRHYFNKIQQDLPTFKIGSAIIHPSPVVKNLGTHFDRLLDMSKQCSAVSRSMYYHVRRISKIRCHLDQTAASRAIQATVISRLDYCNSLLVGTSKSNIDMLQKAQNSAARVLTKTSKRAHISPILRELHWLPVQQRITFKVLVFVFKLLHDTDAPQYLATLLTHHIPTRSLRSSLSYKPLVVPRTATKAGDRAFSTMAPKLWNSLPDDIRISTSVEVFKHKLKTHLFPKD